MIAYYKSIPAVINGHYKMLHDDVLEGLITAWQCYCVFRTLIPEETAGLH